MYALTTSPRTVSGTQAQDRVLGARLQYRRGTDRRGAEEPHRHQRLAERGSRAEFLERHSRRLQDGAAEVHYRHAAVRLGRRGAEITVRSNQGSPAQTRPRFFSRVDPICRSRRRNPGRRRASQKTALEGARLCRASGSYSPLWRRLVPAFPSSRRRFFVRTSRPSL